MRDETAAAYLSGSVGTLRNWTSARYVPFARRGRVVRYHRDSLDRWLAKGSCPGRTTIADARSSADVTVGAAARKAMKPDVDLS
jgi:excisionase family DNA binding protein